MKSIKNKVSMFSIHESPWDFGTSNIGYEVWSAMALDWHGIYSVRGIYSLIESLKDSK